jgi:hypothetical protein
MVTGCGKTRIFKYNLNELQIQGVKRNRVRRCKMEKLAQSMVQNWAFVNMIKIQTCLK